VRVAPEQWPTAVGALLEGVSLVVAEVPARMSPAKAQRLVNRVRERQGILVALGPWPQGAAVSVTVDGSTWRGPAESGRLTERTLHVEVARRGGGRRPGTLRPPARAATG